MFNLALNIQRIRNLFVHNDIKLKGSERDMQAINNHISNSIYLDIDQYGKILMKPGFTIYCLDQFRDFFDELFKSVEDYESESNN